MAAKVLVVHTFYKQKGGEDKAFYSTVEVLKSLGYHVETLTFDNENLDVLSAFDKVRVTLWNEAAARAVERVCRTERIAAVHIHNTFPMASPSVYGAARSAGAKVVQWLHNYRMLCPDGKLLRDGKICELCMTTPVPWRAVAHACYRGSRAASAGAAAMLTMHRLRGTWQNEVDRFVVYTDFVKAKHVEAGFSADRFFVVPNLLHPDPGRGDGGGGYGLFVGRLMREKGVGILLGALDILNGAIPFKIVGSGPLAETVRAFVAGHPEVELLEGASDEQVRTLMKAAEFLVLPSIWYEGGGPLTAVEALATGTPAIVSRLGNLPYYIADGVTGLHFEAGDHGSLASAMRRITGDNMLRREMRHHARAAYLDRYTFEAQRKALGRLMGELLPGAAI